MERAGAGVAYEAMRVFPYARRFAVVCGGGSNGGDGRVAARVLREAGREAVETDVVEGPTSSWTRSWNRIPRDSPTRGGGADRARSTGAAHRSSRSTFPRASMRRPGRCRAPPSTPRLTVTFHTSKVGLHVAPGRFHAGDVAIVDIGLGETRTAVAGDARNAATGAPARRARLEVQCRLGPRRRRPPGTTGCPVLSALAALRADAGYVTLAVPRECLPVVEALALEPVKRGFDWDWAAEQVLEAAERADAVALGPGSAQPEAHALVRAARAARASRRRGRGRAVRPRAALTPAPDHPHPHAGELSRLLGRDSGVGRRAPARGGPGRSGAVRSRRPARRGGTIVQPPGGIRRLATRGLRPSRRQARETCSRASSRHSSRKGSTPSAAAAAARPHTGSPRPSHRIRPDSSRATCSRSCRPHSGSTSPLSRARPSADGRYEILCPRASAVSLAAGPGRPRSGAALTAADVDPVGSRRSSSSSAPT